ncbi:MAG TPA: TIGR03435 family protein [Bryobacteraceae bacterium]|nr:TIGR03435 family protein [Bryobacteraceae bacterium]
MRKTILLAALLCAPLAAQTFEVASIKPSVTPQGQGLRSLREDITTGPDRLTMINVNLNTAVRWAYKLGVYEISAPDWMTSERFDFTAKAANSVPEDQLRAMLQALLNERFKLEVHRQTKEVSGYALVPGKGAPKLVKVDDTGGGEGAMTGAGLVFEGHKMPLSRLCDILASALKTPVRDMTMLEGNYDFKLDMRPYLAQVQPQPGGGLDLVGIAISALQEQLGLRLESKKFPMEVLTVDRMEKTPTEN